MIRGFVLAAALLAGSPAFAQSEDLLECTTMQVTPAFRDKIADAMLAEDSPEADALVGQLVTVSDECAARYALAEAKREHYFAYTVSRLPHDAFAARLGTAGISAAVIDEALDFGPGRTNPVISGDLSRDQVEALVEALAANDVDVDKVGPSSWELVGAYSAATSLMWQALAKLR